ncbi:class I SAM-dependent methyltransferase [Patescibacteria group bacterium]|nr:MAG: class I SAM-dependent methyltransferase [Patescibacteria group bacterium]
MNEHYQSVTAYFAEKAEAYDDVDQQLYWVFSDRFYREVLRRELAPILDGKREIRLLDAGAGTGRWTVAFDALFGGQSGVSGTLVDISPDMLAVAERKVQAPPHAGRFRCQVGNIESMPEVPDASFDVCLSFYNVLSFVEHPERALREIRAKLAPGGVHAAVLGNTYHALYFSLLTGRRAELERVDKESMIRFNDVMPSMRCYTLRQLEELYLAAGFTNVKVLGGPNFLYPGMEETFVHGATERLQSDLGDRAAMDRLLEIELAHYADPGVVGRGNTLLVLARA